MNAGASRPARYLVVGAICAAAHNLVMIAGDALGGHYLPLSFLSFALVTPLGYALHTAFTFREPRSVSSFLRFASGVAAGFPISLAAMAFFCSLLQLPVVVAAPAATLVLLVWNYASAHWAILGHLRPR